MKKSAIVMFVIAYLVWILLSWVPDWQHLIVGLVAAFIVAALTNDLFEKSPKIFKKPRRYFYFIFEYLPVFLWECLKANLDVAYRVIHPALPINPGIVKVKTALKSELGLNPMNDGKIIRLPIPTLTEERRKDLVKVVRRVAEDGKVAIRNVRRDVMQHLRELVTNGDVGDDEERRAEQQVQRITDEHTKSIDDLLKVKEAEIMEV